jgi:hypothetical protein
MGSSDKSQDYHAKIRDVWMDQPHDGSDIANGSPADIL